MKVFRFVCKNCGYMPQKPGQVVRCDNVDCGPYYCPNCGEQLTKLEVVTISDLAAEGIDEMMNSCAELMHTLLCDASYHEFQPDRIDDPWSNEAGACLWYAEQALGTCWQEPTHKRWLGYCADEMEHQNFKSSKELHDFLLVATKAAAEIHFLKAKWPKSGEFLRKLL